MINKNALSIATVLVMSSGITSIVNANETNMENRNFTNKTGIVTPQEGLNVRKTPRIENSNKLFAITYNTKVDVLGEEAGWYKIKVNKIKGYVSSQYIKIIDNESTSTSYKYVNASRVNFRENASLNAKIYQVLNKGQKVKFISSSGKWSKIKYNNKTGYIYSEYLSNSQQPISSIDTGNNSTSIASKRDKIVSVAKAQIGKPYVWGAQGPNSFDCSGLMTYVYKRAVGINLPRTSVQQSTFGTTVSRANLQVGDLIFSSTNGTGKVSHVGIYVGNGQMVHSPKPGDSVKITSINNSYWNSVYLWSKRVL
ncbi:Cell wall-associated hydrolase, NlpC family [Terrisporobacter glycolicus]|nr:Cell wall-associated hydrolase, NlpC family [Terrisporobacter glycolicus]